MKWEKGFTLIELLIVVAIIAILAAIAIPNFLAAQVRSKVSRVKSDLRTISTGLESYNVDNNAYPPSSPPFRGLGQAGPITLIVTKNLYALTSPVSYLTSIPKDPFGVNFETFYMGYIWDSKEYGYMDRESGKYSTWGFWNDLMFNQTLPHYAPVYDQQSNVQSVGPNQIPDDDLDLLPGTQGFKCVPYDPSNGTVSPGDMTVFLPWISP